MTENVLQNDGQADLQVDKIFASYKKTKENKRQNKTKEHLTSTCVRYGYQFELV